MTTAITEAKAIEERYARRRGDACAARYSPIDPYVLYSEQEKDAAIVRLLTRTGLAERISDTTLLEIGCGSGSNLLRFLRLGFYPQNLVGNDLLPDRIDSARALLPSSIRLIPGDATKLSLADEQFDVVCLFTVFSSILADDFQEQLAAKAWSLAKPGGGVLCYDFIFNNPANSDVRGVPIRRLGELFPQATQSIRRITLAPPIGRRVTRWWAGGYSALNRFPMLRSHVLAWLPKVG